MNNTLHKSDIIDKISEKLKTDRIEVGGNKHAYKRKYHLMYNKKIIKKVLDAFLLVVADTIENGDALQIYNYLKIEPKYFEERQVNKFDGSGSYIIPPRYKVRFSAEGKLKEACKRLCGKIKNTTD